MKKLLLFAGLFAALSPAAFASDPAPGNKAAVNAETAPAAQVEVFVTSWCPYCRQLEALLKQNNVPYTRYDVEKDVKGAEIFEKLGGTAVPVARVGKEVIHGYDPDRTLAAIKALA